MYALVYCFDDNENVWENVVCLFSKEEDAVVAASADLEELAIAVQSIEMKWDKENSIPSQPSSSKSKEQYAKEIRDRHLKGEEEIPNLIKEHLKKIGLPIELLQHIRFLHPYEVNRIGLCVREYKVY